MPVFTIPIHETPLLEFNQCHNPGGSEAGGRFCSDDEARSLKDKKFAKPTPGKRGTVGTVNVKKWEPSKEGPVVGKAELEQFGRDMVAHLPGEWNVTVSHTSYEARVTISSVENPSVGLIERSFSRDPENGDLWVDHEFFKIPKINQKQGVGKDIMREQIAFYDRLGAVGVRLYANVNVGGYAWARVGFKLPNAAQLQQNFRAEVLNNVEGAQYDAVVAALEAFKDDGRVIWALADREDGPQILMNTNWSGVLDLRDSETRARLDHYLTPGRTGRAVMAPVHPKPVSLKERAVTERKKTPRKEPTRPEADFKIVHPDGHESDEELWRDVLGDDFPELPED